MFVAILSYVIAPLVTGLVVWFTARRKNDADANKTEAEASLSELQNVEKALAIYRSVIDDLSRKVKELESQVHDLRTKLNEALNRAINEKH